MAFHTKILPEHYSDAMLCCNLTVYKIELSVEQNERHIPSAYKKLTIATAAIISP